jgi:hypothetical protein
MDIMRWRQGRKKERRKGEDVMNNDEEGERVRNGHRLS